QVWLCYLSKHSGVVRWVRQAVRALEFCEAAKTQPAHRTDADALIEKYWLESQILYYKGAGDRHWRHFKRWYRVWRIALFLSLAFAVVFLYLAYIRWANAFQWQEGRPHDFIFFQLKTLDLTDTLQMLVGLSAAIGLAARSFLARRADLELAK